MKNNLRVERLARKEEKLVIKRIFYLSAISLLLIIFIFTWGIAILGKFSEFITNPAKVDSQLEKTSLDAPRLNSIPESTNSASLLVSGFSQGSKVFVFVGSEKAGETNVADGKFSIDNILLKNGENEIFTKAVLSNGKESDPSEEIIVILDTQEPLLEVENPKEGESFSSNNRIKVEGKVDKDAQVYANGFLANINDDGHFEVFVPLFEGENTVEVKALDNAGNVKVEKRKVDFKK